MLHLWERNIVNERAFENVGIDLGTTYSSLAFMDDNLIPRIVLNESGQAVIPSVVFFDDEEIIVGESTLE
ncbi:MAG: Hsp70 family protein [Planctomycetales bacterium]|nr:Hsp70 family protein [Planctomycetales bacterium]